MACVARSDLPGRVHAPVEIATVDLGYGNPLQHVSDGAGLLHPAFVEVDIRLTLQPALDVPRRLTVTNQNNTGLPLGPHKCRDVVVLLRWTVRPRVHGRMLPLKVLQCLAIWTTRTTKLM